MSQNISPEPGQTGWVKFEEGSGSPNKSSSPNRKSPTSSGVSSARGSVNSFAEAVVVNGKPNPEQPGALAVSEIQVSKHVSE